MTSAAADWAGGQTVYAPLARPWSRLRAPAGRRPVPRLGAGTGVPAPRSPSGASGWWPADLAVAMLRRGPAPAQHPGRPTPGPPFRDQASTWSWPRSASNHLSGPWSALLEARRVGRGPRAAPSLLAGLTGQASVDEALRPFASRPPPGICRSLRPALLRRISGLAALAAGACSPPCGSHDDGFFLRPAVGPGGACVVAAGHGPVCPFLRRWTPVSGATRSARAEQGRLPEPGRWRRHAGSVPG